CGPSPATRTISRRAWKSWAIACWPRRRRMWSNGPTTTNCSATGLRPNRDRFGGTTAESRKDNTIIMETTAVHSPLEAFVRDYVVRTGGVLDELEPQVYDLLLPTEGAGAETARGMDGREIVRVAFDPDAIPEHPTAQLVSYGTPLMDRLFADAMQRGRF